MLSAHNIKAAKLEMNTILCYGEECLDTNTETVMETEKQERGWRAGFTFTRNNSIVLE